MDMDNRVVIAGGKGCKGAKWQWKKKLKKKSPPQRELFESIYAAWSPVTPANNEIIIIIITIIIIINKIVINFKIESNI